MKKHFVRDKTITKFICLSGAFVTIAILSFSNTVRAEEEPNPLATGRYYIERVGAHCEWLLTHTSSTDKWNQIRVSAERDAGNTDSENYRTRIAEHCRWFLTHTGDTVKWNQIDESARKDAGVPLIVRSLTPVTSGTVKGSNSKKSMGGGYAEAEATFYRNGLIVIETHSVSTSLTQGTKGSVFVVGSDSNGRALFASPIFEIPTACSKPDSCSSNRRDTIQHQVNSDLAKYVSKLDIYVQDRGTTGLRESINNSIKQSCSTYDDLPPAAKAGIAYETGFAGCGPR